MIHWQIVPQLGCASLVAPLLGHGINSHLSLHTLGMGFAWWNRSSLRLGDWITGVTMLLVKLWFLLLAKFLLLACPKSDFQDESLPVL